MVEEAVRQAIVAELERQASDRSAELTVLESDSTVTIDGSVNIDELVAAIIGAVAGGP